MVRLVRFNFKTTDLLFVLRLLKSVLMPEQHSLQRNSSIDFLNIDLDKGDKLDTVLYFNYSKAFDYITNASCYPDSS